MANFIRFRKIAKSYYLHIYECMCVCLSVQPSAVTEGFLKKISKICRENETSNKISQKQPVLYVKVNVYLQQHIAQLFL